MKALVLKAYNRLSYEDVAEPEMVAGDVLVAVKACGICGSDVHGMDGSTGRRRPPIIMGHEAAGVVAGFGPEVKGWKAGDRVTFDSTIYCGKCEFCRQGQINLCDRRRVLGVSCEEYRQDGAMAEYIVVPERILHRLPENLAFEQAALIEPFSIALHAVTRACGNGVAGEAFGVRQSSGAFDSRVDVQKRQRTGAVQDASASTLDPRPDPTVSPIPEAIVIGAGMIGLALVQVLKAVGCERLMVVDIAEEKLELAKKLGAGDVINPAANDALAKVLELTGRRGAGVSFEAVGAPATVDLAIRSVRKGGSVVLVGNIAPKVGFPLQVAVTRELTVYGSCASRGDYPACINMMASGALRPDALISAVAPMAEGASWFERLYQKERGLLKVVLTP
ncbi:MAG: galactitol-1-phosphate 5-dehydrogenase [Verrucomicrobia bacterium]|nr:MAG: galactitol-1-phosphate 5-dehydrogenase [Verrucomicrobiota bacterium]